MQSKSLTLIGACALAFTSFSSLASETDTSAFIGPSISMGLSFVDNQITADGNMPINGVNYPIKGSKLSGNSTPLTIDLAYGIPLSDKWLVTTGYTYDFGKATLNYSSKNLDLKTSLKQHMSFYVAPGLRIAPQWLAYTKVGYHQVTLANTDINYNRKVGGIGYGVGAAYAITRNLEARAEIEQVKFKKVTEDSISARPQMNRANLLVGYRF